MSRRLNSAFILVYSLLLFSTTNRVLVFNGYFAIFSTYSKGILFYTYHWSADLSVSLSIMIALFVLNCYCFIVILCLPLVFRYNKIFFLFLYVHFTTSHSTAFGSTRLPIFNIALSILRGGAGQGDPGVLQSRPRWPMTGIQKWLDFWEEGGERVMK